MSALNLITSYGSDSESSESESNGTDKSKSIEEHNQKPDLNFFELNYDEEVSDSEVADSDKISATNLPHGLDNPFRLSSDKLLLNASQPSVFANPFKSAEDAEKSALEKHVKLAPKREDMKEINGKKICWNYRKGRCRFGSNCIYAHDELLQPKPEHQSVGQSHSTTSLYKSKTVGKERKRKFKANEVVPPDKVMKSFVE